MREERDRQDMRELLDGPERPDDSVGGEENNLRKRGFGREVVKCWENQKYLMNQKRKSQRKKVEERRSNFAICNL